MTQITNKEISPEGATVSFTTRDQRGSYGDLLVHVSAEGVAMDSNSPVPVDTLAAMLPPLQRVHRALFGDDHADPP